MYLMKGLCLLNKPSHAWRHPLLRNPTRRSSWIDRLCTSTVLLWKWSCFYYHCVEICGRVHYPTSGKQTNSFQLCLDTVKVPWGHGTSLGGATPTPLVPSWSSCTVLSFGTKSVEMAWPCKEICSMGCWTDVQTQLKTNYSVHYGGGRSNVLLSHDV